MTITFFTRTSRLAQQRIKSGGQTRSSCLMQCKDAAPPRWANLFGLKGEQPLLINSQGLFELELKG
jgi:hypothetical protein